MSGNIEELDDLEKEIMGDDKFKQDFGIEGGTENKDNNVEDAGIMK